MALTPEQQRQLLQNSTGTAGQQHMISTTTGTAGQQHMISTTTGTAGILGAPQITKATYDPFVDVDPEVLGNFKIRKIENGFLVQAARYSGGRANTRFAKDMQEVGAIVVSWLVEQRLEK